MTWRWGRVLGGPQLKMSCSCFLLQILAKWKSVAARRVRPPWPCPDPLTARLDTEIKKKNWHCSSTVVSTFILHDNTAGEILMFCNSSNSELCLCDISVPRIPPSPLLLPPSWLRYPRRESPQRSGPRGFTVPDCQSKTPFSTCEVTYLKNGCCGDCV